MELLPLLQTMKEKKASDLHLKVGSPPLVRIYGDLMPLPLPIVTGENTKSVVQNLVSENLRWRFQEELELDFAYTVPNLGRFRVNLFQQRGSMGLVFRLIPERIPILEELGLPPICKELVMRPRGLLLITGPAGCGKTTTQAALIDYRNTQEACHIMTVEDPIEFLFQDKKALVNQRELGNDTLSFADALKYVLRQDPDVILVGEMRDLETISLAITAAETGHLVLATLHTTDAVQTVDRIIDVFPLHQQLQIRTQVSVNFVGVISQILLKRADGRGQVAAFEIMVGTPAVRNLIREAKTYQLTSHLQTGMKEGMTTLNFSLANLIKTGIVTLEEALTKSIDSEGLKQILATTR
ncbi:MAG: type IV pilus twitching motility protein PilT [Candidatus Edwardsbacteria bacterium]